MINEYNSRIKDGEVFEPNKFYGGFLEGFDVTFKEVEKKHYHEYFGWGKWLYKNDHFKVLQLIYPNTPGIWPWDKNASEDFTWFFLNYTKTSNRIHLTLQCVTPFGST